MVQEAFPCSMSNINKESEEDNDRRLVKDLISLNIMLYFIECCGIKYLILIHLDP